MTHRQPPRLALALLERLVPDSEPLIGDLVEAFHAHPSPAWFWRQAIGAVLASARASRRSDIRPLHLVDLQPADAIERTRRFALRFPPVNLTASPVADAGGLGLAILFGLMTVLAPAAWWVFLAVAASGCALGGAMIWLREPA